MNAKSQQNKTNANEAKLSLREKKQQANLRKNTGLYFQIGLIASLVLVFGVFQLKFDVKDFTDRGVEIEEQLELFMDAPADFVIEQKAEVKPQQAVKPQVIDQIEIKDDHVDIVESILPTDEPLVIDDTVKISDLEPVEEDNGEDDMKPIPFVLIEESPTFPGCEKFKNKDKQKNCFMKKLSKHINKKFDADVAANNGLSGKLKISVMFTIDEFGNVVDVKARAPHPSLAAEAEKALKSLPKMNPGKQRDKPVKVTYSQPISFMVE